MTPIRLALATALGLAMACTRNPSTGEPSQESPAAADVRAMRLRSNAAIAAHDLDAFTATLLPDVVVTAGNGGVRIGRDSVQASLRNAFADPTFVDYVRTTDRVDVSLVRPIAAEHGRWMGHWRAANGDEEVSGTYLAMWRRTDAGWRVRSELFVSLACRGPRMCAP